MFNRLLVTIAIILVLWQVRFALLGKLTCGTRQAAGEPSWLSRTGTLIAYYLVIAALVASSPAWAQSGEGLGEGQRYRQQQAAEPTQKDLLRPRTEFLRGLSREELIRYLGKPDQILTPASNPSRAEWRYGNSLIFLVDGKVSAWSDSGDLEERKLISSLQPKNARGRLKDSNLDGWKNAWEKEDEVTSDEVVDDLLNKPEQKERNR